MIKAELAHTGGVYFHIPFCKQACHYCDFHFSTSIQLKEKMVLGLQTELMLQRRDGFLPADTKIGSVYFGGGTPSLLTPSEVGSLLASVAVHYNCSDLKEVTLEANPDDLSEDRLSGYKNVGVNRLSIGIQSFFDDDLAWMNRAHRAGDAERAVKLAQAAGIDNLTSDLIYGFPRLSDQKWASNVDRMIDLGIPHISAYSMTVEVKTALGTRVRRGLELPMDDEQSARQFEFLMERLAEAGYVQYEISNWALPGYESFHNRNYWRGSSYLGIGPSAHGYNGHQRRWNVRNNIQYLRSINQGLIPFEEEVLSDVDRYHEYVMTALRTSEGLDIDLVERAFGHHWSQVLREKLAPYENSGMIGATGENQFQLTNAGKLMADGIAAALFRE